MLHLSISSLEGKIRNEDIKQLTIDTQSGQITVLPGHDNIISVLKPGLIKIVPAETQVERTFSFLVDKEYVVFGCLGGILEVKGNEIQILTNMVILDNQNPVDFLQQSKQTLVEKLQKAKDQPLEHDSLEAEIQKIDVELKLAFWKNK